MKKYFSIMAVALSIFIFVLFLFYKIVELKAIGKLYDDVSMVPYNRVAMVLGTNPKTKYGKQNPFFYYRIDAVVKLYESKKVKFILISGDNKTKDYSEPDVMRQILIERGIPGEVIYVDYAGFRTLDSVVRAKTIFGQTSLTVVSQKFHNERSIVLGEWQDMNIVGFNAKDVESKKSHFMIILREAAARVKLYMDIFVDKKPHFGGTSITIAEDNPQKELNE